MGRQKEQYKSISIIKAFACISVVTAHWKAIFQSMGSPRIDRLVFEGPLVMMIYSSMGVSIFLMLSAALAALKVYRGESVRPEEEVLKRYVRLSLPIFITSMTVLLLQRAGAIYTSEAGALLSNDWAASLYAVPLKLCDLFRISFVTALLREENSFYVPFWMMSYIFLGSLVSMALSVLIRGLNPTGRVIVFSFLLLAMSLLDSYYLCIICGNLLAFLLAGWENKRKSREACLSKASVTAVIPAAGLLFFFMWFSTRAYVIAWNINAAGIGVPLSDSWFWQVIAGFGICSSFIVLYGLLSRLCSDSASTASLPVKILLPAVSVFDAIGKISYEVFLTHWFVMCSFSSWFYCVHAQDHIHISILLNFVLSCTLILLCSVIYHVLISKKAAVWAYHFLHRYLLNTGESRPDF